MRVLSTRESNKNVMPASETMIEVVAIQSGSVRLGISTPDEVCVLQETSAPWAPESASEEIPTLSQIRRLLDKRLEIAQEGLDEMRNLLQNGNEEDARVILEKVDEDLDMLRRRIRREFEKAETLSCGV